jgi:DNA-binding winged helix-turn-helix (wHTH) protein/tetratricopeptide (TPR) repeat protein
VGRVINQRSIIPQEVLNIMSSELGNCVYVFGPFRLETAEFRLLRDGRPVQLKPKVFRLLLMLVRNSGHVLTKGELMEGVWPGSFVEEQNLTVSIFALRKALEETDGHAYIETVPRLGYRFVAEVQTSENQSQNLGETSNRSVARIAKAAPANAMIQSLAVLPFKLIGGAGSTEYLGQGIADALITRLSNLSRIIVRPTGAVLSYTRAGDPIVAGQELKVTAVLDGSIQEIGKQLRVTVQLIRVENGATLWGQKFDESLSDVLKMEDSISEQVARALMLKLTEIERERFARRYTGNSQAYTAYMKGRFFWEKRTIDGLRKSNQYFEQAIELDPDYALAYVGLARSYLFQTDLLLSPPKESVERSRQMIQKALKIDQDLAQAHALLGYICLVHDRDRSSSEREFRLALETNPNSSQTRQFYSYYLKLTRRFDESILEIRRAQEIDPTSPRISARVGMTLYLARRYDEAIGEFEKALELDPDSLDGQFGLGLVYEQKKDYDKAIVAYQRARKLAGQSYLEVLGSLGRAYALVGLTVKAREVLGELLALSAEKYVSSYYIAYVYVGLGEKDRACDCLEKCFENRDIDIALLGFDPIFDSLRSDARFISLSKRALL